MAAPLGVGAVAPAPTYGGLGPARLSRSQALVCAYELIALAQVENCGDEVDARLEVAQRNQWWDVVHMLHFAGALLADNTPRAADHAGSMTESARRSGDDALKANALAHHSRLGLESDRALAIAVALLDDLAGSVVHRPAAYISCYIAYAQRGLTELAEEMLDRAAMSLAEPWPPGLARIAELNHQALTMNRQEVLLPEVCALFEIGEREQARQLASSRYPVPAAVMATIPQEWRDELAAVTSLFEAISGEPESVPAAVLLGALAPVRRQGYRATVILAQAIRRFDAGDVAGAAALAETALLHDDIETRRMVTNLGLYLVAQGDTSSLGWRRYAEHQARQRLQTHDQVLSAARAELQTERSLLDTERSNRRAYLDELTGLANRHAYSRYLNRLRHGPGDDAVAVLMVDIDHFKAVNDRFGHAVGDEVLRGLGSMLLDLTRATDMAVRLGGDEFLLLLTGRGPMDVVDRAERLVRQVAEHEWVHTAEGLTVSVSAGLSTGPAKDIAGLLDAADRNLYSAKSGGRGCLVHDRPN